MPTTQTGRTAKFHCQGLGDDVLLLNDFVGDEGLSQLYRFEVDLRAEESVNFSDVLGKGAVITLSLPGEKSRSFQGVIKRFSQGGRDQNFIKYRAEIVPAAWYLTRQTNSRVFQKLPVPDILKEVFRAAGLKDVKFKFKGSYPERLYCIQYRETNWAFASRLMEEEGIFYFFEHCGDDGAPIDGGAHLILADSADAHAPLPVAAKLIYDLTAGGIREEERITTWEKSQEVRTGVIVRRDYHFTAPTQMLDGKKAINKAVKAGTIEHKLTAGGGDKLEQYDSQSDFVVGDEADFNNGDRTAAIRAEEETAGAVLIAAESDCGQVTSGYAFTLEQHFDADGDYVVHSVSHEFSGGVNFRSAGDASPEYANRFTCFPLDLPFRPPRITPRPVVHGTQTATVVGPAGDEIFTDEYARIKVQFHWDREGKNDADSSCFIRVATPVAGEGWGMIHIPRIGQEVIVAHEEGDPDRPIVVGSVYNALQVPPWSLPANRTQSGMQSRSSTGGSAANTNVFRFEDKKGSEQVYLHAEKDQSIEVENDESHSVGHDRSKSIGHDEKTTVKHDRTETVDNNETITVHGARTETVDKDETIMIHSNRTETVDKNETLTVSGHQSQTIAMTQTTMIGLVHTITVGAAQAITVGAAQTISVGGLQAVTVGAMQAITVGRNATETIGGKWSQTVAKDHDTKVGGNRGADVAGDESVKAGKKIAVEAADQIQLSCGAASLLMKKDGTILLKGKDITVEGSGKISIKATSDLKLKGSKIASN